MIRFITSSWTVALIAAVVVLSRGTLLASLGLVSPDYAIMLLLSLWLATCAHMLRTGAVASRWAAGVLVALMAFFERSLLILYLTMPLLLLVGFSFRSALTRPIIKRLRLNSRRLRAMSMVDTSRGIAGGGDEEGQPALARLTRSVRWLVGLDFPPQPLPTWRLNYQGGTLLRTLSVPFLLWAFWQRRWLQLSFVGIAQACGVMLLLILTFWGLAGAAGTALLLELGRDAPHELSPVLPWLATLYRPFDLHLALSAAVLLLCALQSPAAGLPSFFEWSWLVLASSLLLVVSAYTADSFDFRLVRALVERGIGEPALLHLLPRRVILWLEPALLSFGVAGVYNLMKVLDTRIVSKV